MYTGTFDRWLLGAAGLVALLVVAVLLTLQNTRRLNEDASRVARSHEVMDSLEEVVSNLREAEAHQRTFLLTGDDTAAAEFASAVDAAKKAVGRVRGLTGDNPDQEARIPGLEQRVNDLTRFWSNTAAVRKEQGFDAAQKIVAEGQSRRAMAELNALVRRMDDTERGLLAERTDRREQTYRSAVVTGLLTGTAAVAGVVAFMLLLRRHTAARTAAAFQLAEQGERLRTTLASIGDAVITTDTAGRVTGMNAVAEALTGWSTADAAGVPLAAVFNIVNEDTRRPVENPAFRALREGVIVGLANHTVLIARDGTERPIDDSAAPIRCKAGEVVGCVLVFRDITERHEAERRLRESERQFRTLAESIPQLCWMAEPDGHIFWYNRRWYDYTGTTLGQMQGWGWEAVHDPAELPRMLPRWKAALAAGEPWEDTFPLRRHDGEYRTHLSRAFPVKDGGGRVVRWFGTNTDIEEQRRAEDALRRSESFNRTLLASTLVGLYVHDADAGRNVYINPEYTRITGYTQADLDRMDPSSFLALFHADDLGAVQRHVRAVVEGRPGQEFEIEYRFKVADGRWLTLLSRDTLLSATDGGRRLLGTFLDITQRKRAETDLRVRSAELESLLASAPIGFAFFDRRHRYTRINDELAAINGIRAADHIGRTVAELLPVNAAVVDPVIDRVFATGQAVRDLEVTGETPARPGVRRHWLTTFYPVRDEQGDVAAVGVTVSEITDRRRAEERLRESEGRLRLALTAARMVAWEWTPADGRLRVSENAADVFGLPAGVGLTGIDQGVALLHPDDAAAYRATFRKAIDGRNSYLTHYRLVRPNDGRVIWVEERGHTVFDQPGDSPRLYGVATDVTARREAEERLREQEERLRLAVEATGVGIFDYDPATGRQTFCEQAMQIWGFPPGTDPTPELVLNAVHPDDREWVRAATQAALDPAGTGRLQVKHRIVRPDGEVRWVATSGRTAFCCCGTEGVRSVGTMLDVTDTEQVLQELRQSQRREQERAAVLETVLRATPTPIWISRDRECREITGNPASYRLLKMPDTGVVSATAPGDLPQTRTFKEYRDGQPLDPRELPMQVAAREGVEVNGTELTLVFADGEVRTIYGNAVPLRDDRGRVAGAISAFVDITRLKEAEDALREADRRKDEFLATLAHELRNPLAPLRTAVSILRMVGPKDAQLEGVRDMIERQVNQLVRLVDDLLDLSRVSRGKIALRRERVPLSAVVQHAVETSGPLIEAGKHRLTISDAPETVSVEGDLTRLAQVVSNLLNNAAKYTPEGGHITLSVGAEGGQAVVRVRDTGVGIPADMLPNVFQMFTQVDRTLGRSQGGLGIGLALVRRLVEMHGGTVEVHSEGEGRGSEFAVRLPAAATEKAAAAAEGNGPPTPTGPARRILVVDDNVDAAESLSTLLSLDGHEVRTVHGGPAALEQVRAFCPQVVLLDIGMPGMDGYETARAVRDLQQGRAVVLVALTGWGQEEDRRRTERAGFDHHFVKPVDYAVVQRLLATLRGI